MIIEKKLTLLDALMQKVYDKGYKEGYKKGAERVLQLNDTVYLIEPGWTWAEFLDSPNNTSGLYRVGYDVYNSLHDPVYITNNDTGFGISMNDPIDTSSSYHT